MEIQTVKYLNHWDMQIQLCKKLGHRVHVYSVKSKNRL